MKTIILFAIGFMLTLYSCTRDVKTESKAIDKTDVSEIFDSYWEDYLKFYPLEATQQGDNRYNGLLVNDQTQQFRDSLGIFYRKYLKEISKVEREELSKNDKLSYDIFIYEINIQLLGLKTNEWMIPFSQFTGLPLTMGQLGSGDGFQPFKTKEDYSNWLKRIDGFAVWTDSAIVNFRKGIKAGVVLPKPLVEKMIPQMEAMVVEDPKKSLF
ncbi:MAG TPA: DUF885 family protein, partial [Pedobacter sp.]